MPQAILDLLSHALTFVPIVGPILGGLLAAVVALWKPAQAAAVGLGAGVLNLARTLLAVPGAVQVLLGVLIAVLVVAIVLLIGQVNAAKAALIDPAGKTSWQAEVHICTPALTAVHAQLAAALAANARQSASIQVLHDAGQGALAKSAALAAGLSTSAPAIARRSAAVTAADQGPSECDRVLNVDSVFAGGL